MSINISPSLPLPHNRTVSTPTNSRSTTKILLILKNHYDFYGVDQQQRRENSSEVTRKYARGKTVPCGLVRRVWEHPLKAGPF